MEKEVLQSKPICKEDAKIAQGAVGSYEKAPPEHRADPPNPNVDIVSFGLRIVFHDAAQPIRWTTPRLFLAPGLKCSLPIGLTSRNGKNRTLRHQIQFCPFADR